MNDTENNSSTDMAQAEWQQVLSLFDDISELTPAEQSQQLLALDLRDQAKNLLQKMLDSLQQPNLLDQTIDPLVEALLGADVVNEHVNPSDIIGRTFGAWKAISTLGSGGMGQVFLAERADGQFEKNVALKVIKSGQFSALSQQRFLAEMRTLAQFEHPNIAHLIDGGTSEDGIAYFIMELVTGQPIVDYADDKRLALSDRIKLVLQVIDAIEYAHQSLIIHGDIKPANVLVNESGQVKLVDFGIARSLEDDRPNSYLPQFSPRYSAPEQAQGMPLTTASDVFGLCAVLYELCTGSPPRSGELMTSPVELSAQGDTPILAAHSMFQLNQKQLGLKFENNKDFNQALSQELGAIIDKGLEIDVSNRYKNTTELRRDLGLFLDGSAVPSYADNWLYRCRKSVIKHKWAVSFSFLAISAIIMVTLVALNQARLAQQEADKANWAKDFVLGIFDEADPVKNQQNPISVNEITQKAADHLLLQDLDYAPEVKLTSLSLLGNIQFKLGQTESATQIHQKYLELLQQFSPDPERIAAAHFDLALDYQQLGNFEAALREFEKTSQVLPLETKVTHMGVMALQSMAISEIRMNNLAAANEIISELKAIEDKILDADQPDNSMSNVAFAEARLAIAEKKYPAALQAINKAKNYALKLPENPILAAEFLSTEADVYAYLKQFDLSVKAGKQAFEIFRRHYGPSHPETLIALSNHASNLGNSGQHEASIVLYHEMLNTIKDLPVPDFYQPIMLQNLAHQYRKNSQFTQAIEYFKQAIPLWQSLQQPNPAGLASTLSGVARSYHALGELELAEKYFDQALHETAQHQGTGGRSYAKHLLLKVPLMIELNNTEKLIENLPRIEHILTQAYGEDSPEVADLYLNWAQFHSKQGDLTAASLKAQLALAAYLKNHPTDQYQQSIAAAKVLIL